MDTRYILAALSIVFLGLGAMRALRDRNLSHPQTHTWFLIGVIFAIVSVWLALSR